jgi:hypothetical protein
MSGSLMPARIFSAAVIVFCAVASTDARQPDADLDELCNRIFQHEPREMILVEFTVDPPKQGTIRSGFDPITGAWYRHHNGHILLRTPDGQHLQGAETDRELRPYPQCADESSLDPIMNWPLLSCLCAHRNAVKSVQRTSDHGWIIVAAFPSPRCNYAAEAPASLQKQASPITLRFDAEGVLRSLQYPEAEPSVYTYAVATQTSWDRFVPTQLAGSGSSAFRQTRAVVVSGDDRQRMLQELTPARFLSAARVSSTDSRRVMPIPPKDQESLSVFARWRLPLIAVGIALLFGAFAAWWKRR